MPAPISAPFTRRSRTPSTSTSPPARRRGARRRPASVIAALICLGTSAVGTAAASPLRGGAPSALRAADEIHYTLMGPTSVTFDWRGPVGTIRYGLRVPYSRTVTGGHPAQKPISSAEPFWEASLRHLLPDSTYHYSIAGSADSTFRTAPQGGFRFDAEADVSESGTRAAAGVTQRQIAADHPRLVLVAGDLSYANLHGQRSVDRHFNDVMAWSRKAAYMPAWGNHEWQDPCPPPVAPTSRCDSLVNYTSRFRLPNAHASPGSPNRAGEDWYWFDAGGVRFIAYPEPYGSATWPDWGAKVRPIMAQAQSNPRIHFIVTFGHQPAYSSGHHDGSGTLASIINSLGDSFHKYRLNLSGHSHDYERFSPIHGVTHITTGGGGEGLESPGGGRDARSVVLKFHLQHLRIDVTSTALHVAAICGPATAEDTSWCRLGALIDSVTIRAAG